jgi:uncharacterized protein (TIGR02246 family)
MADDMRALVEGLARRVQALEDELEIQKVIVRYGFAVDTGEAERTGALYTENTVFDVDGRNVMRGRAGVEAMVRGASHQSLLPNCAHTIGPAVVRVDGDRASATGYSRIYVREGEAFRLFRIGCNHWELERRNGAWQIAHRTSRMVGEDEAQDILRRGLV